MRVHEITDDLIARAYNGATVGRVERLRVGRHTLGLSVAGAVAIDDAGRAVAVRLSGAAATHVDRAIAEVLVSGFEAFVLVAVDALAGVARDGLYMITAALDPGVVHVEFGRGPAIDPEDLIKTRGLAQLLDGESHIEEDALGLLMIDLAAHREDLAGQLSLVVVLVDDDHPEALRIATLALQQHMDQVRIQAESRVVIGRRANERQLPDDAALLVRHAHDVGVFGQVAMNLCTRLTDDAAAELRRHAAKLHDPEIRVRCTTQQDRHVGLGMGWIEGRKAQMDLLGGIRALRERGVWNGRCSDNGGQEGHGERSERH
jgi:hypothetical protein